MGQKGMVMRSFTLFGILLSAVVSSLFLAGCPTEETEDNTHTVTVNISPAASGSVNVTPSGPLYESGTVVEVTATAATGYTFIRWEGSRQGTDPSMRFSVYADVELTAIFQALATEGEQEGEGETEGQIEGETEGQIEGEEEGEVEGEGQVEGEEEGETEGEAEGEGQTEGEIEGETEGEGQAEGEVEGEGEEEGEVEGEGQVEGEEEGEAEGEEEGETTFPATVIINEILAANESVLSDEDGNYSDWIELHNTSEEGVSLAGWSLSDDPDIADKWVFPEVTLGAGGYLIVFASGKDRRPNGAGQLHTSFKLDQDGEYLALFSVDSLAVPVPVSVFSPEFPPQRTDFSYGLVDAYSAPRYLTTPSPGMPNTIGSSYAGIAATPEFSVAHGFFNASFTLQLSTETTGAEIRYTLDGSVPTALNGTVYASPLNVGDNTVVRAVAFESDHLPSEAGTQTYIFGATATQKYLPALCVVGDPEKDLWAPDGIMVIDGGYYDDDGDWQAMTASDFNSFLEHGSEWERKISLEFFDPNGAPGSEALLGFQYDCGIRLHGSPGRRQQYRISPTIEEPWPIHQYKKSFRFYFRDDYGKSRLRYPVIPLGNIENVKHMVLRAGTDDPYNPFVKDELSRRLMDQMGNLTCQGTFVHLYLNGYFKNYYNLVEGYTEDFFQHAYDSDEDWDVVKGIDDASVDRRELVEGDWDAWLALRDYVANNDLSNPSNYATISMMVDIDNFIDYLIIECYGANFDWPRNNWYMARERSTDPDLSRWRYYVWDMEMCYYAMSDSAEDFSLESYTDNPFHLEDGWTFLRAPGTNRDTSPIALLYQGLRENDDFKAAWEARANELLGSGGVLTTGNVQGVFNELKDEVGAVLLYPPMNTFISSVWAVERPDWLLYWFGQEGLMPAVDPPAR